MNISVSPPHQFDWLCTVALLVIHWRPGSTDDIELHLYHVNEFRVFCLIVWEFLDIILYEFWAHTILKILRTLLSKFVWFYEHELSENSNSCLLFWKITIMCLPLLVPLWWLCYLLMTHVVVMHKMHVYRQISSEGSV